MKTKTLIILFFVTTSVAVAQKKVAKFFPAATVGSGGSQNLHQLVKGYMSPIAEDFGQLSNGGWYTTAAVHKQFGFDINLTVNTITIQSDAKSFVVPSLSGISYLGNGPAQTVYGKEGVMPEFMINGEQQGDGVTFSGPDGAEPDKDLPVGSLAIPTLQLGMGVYKGTDVYVRFSPALTVNDVEVGNWGVALKHDIKQHIPGISELPFSLSLFAGYTSTKATVDLSGHYTGTGQEGVAQSKAYTVQVLVGKAIKVISVYAGIGYNASTTDFDINGTFNVNANENGQPLANPTVLTNPFSDSYSKGGFRGTAGLRLKFGPVILNGDYTLLNKQSIISAGFGFSFDKKIN